MGGGFSRRGVVGGMIAGAMVGLTDRSPAQAAANADPLSDLGLIDAARRLCRGDMKAEDYAIALLSRAGRWREYNFFDSLESDALISAAQDADRRRAAGAPLGPLCGVPLAIKDNIETRVLPTTAGTPALGHFVAGRDAPVLARLRDAGALVFGKAGMHEMAIGATSNNAAFGAIHNPYRYGYLPGGSSGGSAAAVAARVVPAALGSDTAGSIRQPASMCGVVGYRPPTGRYPAAGIIPLSPLRDTAGPLCRRVADAALLDSLMAGEAPSPLTAASLKGLRIGLGRVPYWEQLDAGTAAVCEAALAALRKAGAVLVEAPMTAIAAANARLGFEIILYEASRAIPAWLGDSGAGISFADLVAGLATPNVRAFLSRALKPDPVPEATYRKAVKVYRPALQEAYRRWFADNRVDAALMPATPLPARPHSPDQNVEYLGQRVYARIYNRNLDASSYAGIPSLSLPAGLDGKGLPVGLVIDGPDGRDRRLLEIGAAVENLLGTLPPPTLKKDRPKVHPSEKT